MRPERLELEGFTAFREPTTVDFTDADLFAFWGPTGAGKSSLIDAIIFALYGSVPRYANKNLVAPVISQQATEARVHLTFAVGPQRYVVARVVRATASGGATTKEARFERHGADGTVEVLAGDADGVTAGVEQLLGLSYEHFTTCVVLPQGQFARFLHAKPSERQELLVRLLGLGVYGRMARLAGERQAASRGRREAIEASLADIAVAAGLDEGRRDDLATRVGGLDELLGAIDATREELDRLEDTEAAALVRQKEAMGAVTALGRVRAPDGLGGLADLVAEARRALTGAEVALAVAEAGAEAAEAAAAALPGIDAIDADRARWRQRDELVGRLATGSAKVAEQAATADALLDAQAQAEAVAQAAQDHLEHARTADLAAALTEGLTAGDPCPVCGNPLDGEHIDDDEAAGTLAEARAVVELATARVRAAREAATAAQRDQARFETLLAERSEQLAAVEAVVLGRPTPAELEVAAKAAAAAADATAAARRSLVAARRAVTGARDAVAALDARERAAWTALDDTRDKLGRYGPPRAGRRDLGQDWQALMAWAATRRDEASDEADAARAEVEGARSAVVTLTADYEARALALGAATGRNPVRDRVVSAREAAAADLSRLVAELERRLRLTEEHTAAAGDEAVARDLALHLRADRFQRWLLGEAFERLVAGATGLLHELSGGAYSLRLDERRDFSVVDHRNADTVRGVRTLSGGETFLASLALALALADQVVDLAAGGSARLESLFLDEGFGTLDPETLDVVAAAIEELGSRGRMVGLVSHVRDLAERLPVRFEVAKGPTTATVTRVGA